jgi:hypothetical protein
MELTLDHADTERTSPTTQSRAGPAAVPRHDFYAVVHKGLRACLADALLASGRADPDDDREITSLVTRVRALGALCRLHAQKENVFVHPAMEARRPGSSEHTAADHVHHAEALARLEASLQELERASGRARAEAMQGLYRGLAWFVADNLAHMHAEETDNNAVLWACYSDAELAQIERDLVASISPADKLAFIGWMASACGPAERASLLAGMRDSVPAPAFERILAAIRPRLTEAEWGKLASALGA